MSDTATRDANEPPASNVGKWAIYYNGLGGHQIRQVTRETEKTIYFEPLIKWGSTSTAKRYVRAYCGTEDEAKQRLVAYAWARDRYQRRINAMHDRQRALHTAISEGQKAALAGLELPPDIDEPALEVPAANALSSHDLDRAIGKIENAQDAPEIEE